MSEENTNSSPTSMKIQSFHYCLLSNIPEKFHSAELRNFFAVFVAAGKFNLFHFRHRSQTLNVSSGAVTNNISSSSKDGKEENQSNPVPSVELAAVKKFCSIIRFSDERTLDEFMKKYNMKLWMDSQGNELRSKVLISKVDLSPEDLEKFSTKELRPPSFMPKGNIGTPNQHFLNLIKECKLPPSLIKKLGLEFPRGRVFKRYSNVPYDYGTTKRRKFVEEDEEEEEVTDGKGRVLSSNYGEPRINEKSQTEESLCDSDKESNADDDEDRCEEWERHEALNDHRTSHGTMADEDKERLYEEKIELKWEKGGSGLVFYTDAQFWEDQEEDHDDWDVDMEGYYVPGGGDTDAKDFMEMRRSERFQQGLEDVTVFAPKSKFKILRPPSPIASCSSTNQKIGAFEKHTRGIGRKILEKSGWKDGQGLGTTIIGMPEALDNDGQGPSDRRGFGFYGEKLEFTTKASKNRRKDFKDYCLNSEAPERIIIGTIYDKPTDLDTQEPLSRRNAPTFIKRYKFVKGSTNSDTSNS